MGDRSQNGDIVGSNPTLPPPINGVFIGKFVWAWPYERGSNPQHTLAKAELLHQNGKTVFVVSGINIYIWTTHCNYSQLTHGQMKNGGKYYEVDIKCLVGYSINLRPLALGVCGELYRISGWFDSTPSHKQRLNCFDQNNT
ncbi:unnamed protein product, partial [marine sediment metagenome]